MPAIIETKEKLYSLEEYFALEEKAEVKHEFHNGKLYEMPGAKFNHNAIAASLITALNIALDKKGKPCIVLTSDMRVYIPKSNKVVYPDITVLCENPLFYQGREDIITNPMLIVEVLSDSTEGYDRGEKFNDYSSLSSFREYMLVSQDKVQVEVFYLQDDSNNLWKRTVANELDETIQLYSVDCSIVLKDVYKRVKI